MKINLKIYLTVSSLTLLNSLSPVCASNNPLDENFIITPLTKRIKLDESKSSQEIVFKGTDIQTIENKKNELEVDTFPSFAKTSAPLSVSGNINNFQEEVNSEVTNLTTVGSITNLTLLSPSIEENAQSKNLNAFNFPTVSIVNETHSDNYFIDCYPPYSNSMTTLNSYRFRIVPTKILPAFDERSIIRWLNEYSNHTTKVELSNNHCLNIEYPGYTKGKQKIEESSLSILTSCSFRKYNETPTHFMCGGFILSTGLEEKKPELIREGNLCIGLHIFDLGEERLIESVKIFFYNHIVHKSNNEYDSLNLKLSLNGEKPFEPTKSYLYGYNTFF